KCEGRKEIGENLVSECATAGTREFDSTKVAGASYLPEDRPVQKNKKKCWDCQGKLELAQRELGKCRCGYIYCQLHRLPEKHNCVFNHKESGREEARQKMVPAGPKKVGRSFQRMDE
ncbi:AN1-type zinc finger domain-containing protein, partial [Salmonella sp. s54925]|uniref:AN1-type zinc finger domain-containing protein n=1 Tax=Salmonella sp. s54925 TaxID=3159674 RepID=UPI003980A1AF